MGLVSRLVEPGGALDSAAELAHELAALPQTSLRMDRLSAIEQWSLPLAEAMANELARGRQAIASGETEAGANRFVGGAGRHGARADGVEARQATATTDAP